MKQDISFDPIAGVSVAVVLAADQALNAEGQLIWQVYLLNENDFMT